MNATIVAIAAQEISHEIDRSLSLVDRLKFAMNKARDHWMATEDIDQLKGAVGAVMLTYEGDSEEYLRIRWELEQMNKLSLILSNAQQGISYSIDSFVNDVNTYEPIGIMKLWRESKR